MGESLALQRLAELAVYRGDRAAAEQLCKRSLELAAESSMADHLMVRIYATLALNALEHGDPHAAAQAVEASEAAAAQYGMCATCSALLHPVAVEAHAQLGDAQKAIEQASKASEVASNWGSGAWIGMAEMAEGIVAQVKGEQQEALRRLKVAAGIFKDINQPFEQGRCLYHAGLAHYRGGDIQEARKLLEEALSIFQDLGARKAEANVRGTLSSISKD